MTEVTVECIETDDGRVAIKLTDMPGKKEGSMEVICLTTKAALMLAEDIVKTAGSIIAARKRKALGGKKDN